MGRAKIIRERRLELGLSDVDVAKKLGLTIHEYGDIEQHDHELIEVVSIGTTHRLCDLLGLSLQQVFKISSVDEASHLFDGKRPGELVMQRREQKGYSVSDLAQRVGFDETTIESLETIPSFGNSLPVFLLNDIETELGLPEGSLVIADWNQR
jgi:transcriptional regulator with XRE-family HTH domain